MSEELKQLLVRIPDSLHRELKKRCVDDGLTLGQAVDSLTRGYLAGRFKIGGKGEDAQGRHGKRGKGAVK